MKKEWVFCLVSAMAFPMMLWGAGSRPEKTERTLTIQGQAKVSVVPDVAVIAVEVLREGTDVDPVLSEARTVMNRILEVVKSQGVSEKDIRTDLFQVRPKYEQDKRGNPHPIGYTVRNQISIKVRDLKKVGKVLTTVLDAGATSVRGPDFELNDPDSAERQALALAAKDARAKAQSVAAAAGVQLGEILTINPQTVNWPSPLRPMMMRAMAMPAAAAAEEPISVGEQTLTGYVSMTFVIR